MQSQSQGASIAPNWTELPPLKLLGVGTPLVESLQSYARRMLETTGLSHARLGRHLRRLAGYSDSWAHWIGSSAAIGPTTMARTRQLEILTGVSELRCGTLWALSEVLATRVNTFREHRRRWCPVCYREWDDRSYEPLVWHIDLLRDCPVHHVPLQHHCPKCGSPQPELLQTELRRECRVCECPLWYGDPPRSRAPFAEWVDSQVLELAEFCGTPRDAPMPWSDYAQFAMGFRDNAMGEGKLKAAMREALSNLERQGWLRHRPTIRLLINLCALQGIALRDLLYAPKEASSPLLIDQWSGMDFVPLPRPSQAQAVYVAINYMEAFVRQEPEYFPSPSTLLWPLQAPIAAIRAACAEFYDWYEGERATQGDSARQARLASAFHCAAAQALDDPGTRATVHTIAKKVQQEMGCPIEDAKVVAKAALVVRQLQAERLVSKLKEEMPPRDAIEWFTAQWGRRAYRGPWSQGWRGVR